MSGRQDDELSFVEGALLVLGVIIFAIMFFADITNHPNHIEDWGKAFEALGDD